MSPIPPERFRALFEPRGVVVAGVSGHPAKFGFVALHNILTQGYEGEVFGTNLEGGEVLGIPMCRSVDELPDGRPSDLAFVCTPAAANEALLRSCAARGISAVFITSGGYGEAGDEGRGRRGRLVALADELGIAARRDRTARDWCRRR